MTDLPETFWRGVEQFNQGHFYACHDTLEALWMEASDPPKSFYQGILQIAVACYHLGNQNWRGAVILLGEGIRRLQPYEPDYAQIDVELLVATSTQLLTNLQHSGPEQVGKWGRWVEAGGDRSPNPSTLPIVIKIASPSA
jgi:predicted metal-dependent hydrolase